MRPLSTIYGDNHPAPQNLFDQKRLEFLAAIYEGDIHAAGHIYKDMAQDTASAEELSEADLKAVYQIQQAFRSLSDRFALGPFKPVHDRIRKQLALLTRKQTRHKQYVDFDQWRDGIGLSDKALQVMLGTVSTLQLTVGCSNFCRRCNEWALPGPRKHFTFDAVKHLVKLLFETGNRDFSLYCASDPLDWRQGDNDISHIWDFMKAEGFRPQYGLLTKAPRGSFQIIERLLLSGADIGFSVTDQNRETIQRLKKTVRREVDIQHDFQDLLIPARLDADFMSIHPSITDHYGMEVTPEGACTVVPTFTSPLHPTGQRRIPVDTDTRFFLQKQVGREAWKVVYFKPLSAVDLNGKTYRLEGLLAPQIENMLLDYDTGKVPPPGMMNLSEYFKTYEPDAVRQRKKMLPAVAKERLRQLRQCQSQPAQATWARDFKKYVLDYYATCRMQDIMVLKRNAFSFYLRTIAEYLRTHQVEKRIITFLWKNVTPVPKGTKEFTAKVQTRPLDRVIQETETGLFELFRSLIQVLLADPHDVRIQTFIEDHPVPSADCFL